MNRQEIEQNLNEVKKFNLNVPTGHKQQLKVALLEYGTKHRPSVLIWVKENFKSMQTNFKPSTFVAGALVGVLIFSGVQYVNNSPFLASHNPFATKKSQAQAAVKNAMFKAKRLSPEALAKIESSMKADMKASLEEAYAAKDLTISTKAEMEKDGAYGFSIAKVQGNVAVNSVPAVAAGTVSVEAGHKAPEVEKYLKYTDPKGRNVTLGINAEGVVVFKMVQIQISEGDKQRIEQEIKATGGFGFTPVGSMSLSATGSAQMVPFEGGSLEFKTMNGDPTAGFEAGEAVEFNVEGGANVKFDKIINLDLAE